MSIRDQKFPIVDRIPVKNVLISVFDKSGLEPLVEAFFGHGDPTLFSTGGTYGRLAAILDDQGIDPARLVDVEDYTGLPPMEGGLVKTLDAKLHAGILGERNNPDHQEYLRGAMNGGVFIDMVVVNLYPFSEVVARPDTTWESARGNIDIGGPTMVRGAAKNHGSVAVLSDVSEYEEVIEHLVQNEGTTDFQLRTDLAVRTFGRTARYDAQIAKFMQKHQSSAADGYVFE